MCIYSISNLLSEPCEVPQCAQPKSVIIQQKSLIIQQKSVIIQQKSLIILFLGGLPASPLMHATHTQTHTFVCVYMYISSPLIHATPYTHTRTHMSISIYILYTYTYIYPRTFFWVSTPAPHLSTLHTLQPKTLDHATNPRHITTRSILFCRILSLL